MNHYGDWWNYTITLYNRVEGSDGKITWYRHILDDCFYTHTLDKIQLGDTVVTSDVSICRIRVSEDFVNKRVYDEQLTDDERQQYFTLCAGDIIVPEEVDFDIVEYVKGQRSSDLLKKYRAYPGCFTVTTAKINVGGNRGNEHYYARGA